MSKEVTVNDDELDQLMAELDAHAAVAAAKKTPEPTPAPVVEAKPEPVPEPEPVKAVAEPLPWEDDPPAKVEEDTVDQKAALAAAMAEQQAMKEKRAQELALREALAAKQAAQAEAEAKKVEAAPVAQPTQDQQVVKPAGLKYGIDVDQFKTETAISDTNLDNCMMEQSALRAYYHQQAALAEAQHARLKARFEVKEAELYDKHRKALALTGDKVTEKAVENAVKLDPTWLRMKNTVIESETIANVNRGLCIALADRKDMLVQIGADRRNEMQGQLRVMAEQDLRNRAVDAARRTQ